MSTWIDRYRSGDHEQVWSELEAAGIDTGTPESLKAAREVVRETLARARRNVMWLFDGLSQLGYRFNSESESTPIDYPLELRIHGALEFVRAKGGRKYRTDPWAHPALEFLEEEGIELPAHHRNGKPGRANYRPPTSRTPRLLDEMEFKLGLPLPLATRGWFETIGSVDLAGTHPILNRDGAITSLRVVLDPEITPLAAGSAVGADFVAFVREAFACAGFPGWSGAPNPPLRELAWLRAGLMPL